MGLQAMLGLLTKSSNSTKIDDLSMGKQKEKRSIELGCSGFTVAMGDAVRVLLNVHFFFVYGNHVGYGGMCVWFIKSNNLDHPRDQAGQ